LRDMYQAMTPSHWRAPYSTPAPSFIFKIMTSLNTETGQLRHMMPLNQKSRENLLRHLDFFMNCTLGFLESQCVPVYHMHLIEVTVFSPGCFWFFSYPSSFTYTNLKWVNNVKTTWTLAIYKNIHPCHLLFMYANY
jgi:hypothetical protein